MDYRKPFSNFYKQKRVLETRHMPSIFNETQSRESSLDSRIVLRRRSSALKSDLCDDGDDGEEAHIRLYK